MATKKVKIYTLLVFICGGLAGITCKILQTPQELFDDQNSKNTEPKETQKAESSQKQTIDLEKEHLMIVFVHGTIFNFPSFGVYKETKNEQKKYPKKTFFKTYKNNLRKKTLYNSQTINEFGLIAINFNETNEDTKNNRLLANVYKSAYREINSNPNLEFHFYTFGWDGALDQKSREKWGFNFYEQLKAEIDQLKKTPNSSNIKLEILAHSHGGNVALNLAKAEEQLKQNLEIDKLILLGTPVQSETSDFANNKIFKKVYNIYSRGDTIQVIDIISTKDSASKRRFKDADNLVQIEIKADKMQPSHTELWLLGKGVNMIYRKKFPLNPLPVFVFSPIITGIIEQNDLQIKNINLKIKAKTDYLKFNFYNDDIKKKYKKDQTIPLTKYAYKFKNFENLKTLALSPPIK
jgi:hypothetical protein